MINQEQVVSMTGVGGQLDFKTPSNYQNELKYLTVENLTDNKIVIYAPDDIGLTRPILTVGQYMVIPVALYEQIKFGCIVVYTNPGNTNAGLYKLARLKYSDIQQGNAQSYAPSFQGSGGAVNATLSSDLIGLAKQVQLPANLTANGNLKVAIEENDGWIWKKVTAAGAGDVSISAVPCLIAKISNEAAATVYLKDGATQAWISQAASNNQDFSKPLKCATSASLNFSVAGSAWVVYKNI